MIKGETEVKLKNREIQTLWMQMEQLGKKNFPVKLSFKLAKNKRLIAEIAEIIESQRKEICEKYAKKNENGEAVIDNGIYVIEDKKGLDHEYHELMEIETEVAFLAIQEADLEKCGEGRFDAISLDEMEILQKMM